MKKVEDECIGCPPEMGCLGDGCPNRNATRYYCDNCGSEEKLYHYDNEELCEECLLEKFEVVEGTD